MTHANDERLLFGSTYGQGGRRKGQGPEVYARGLFEAMNNTQRSNSTVGPTFNLNTTLTISDAQSGETRVQFKEAANSPERLEQDTSLLMDIILWMEAKEAEIAL